LYFLASREETGMIGSDAEWDLLCFTPSTGKLRKVTGEFRDPVDLDVTPNGKTLIISSTRRTSTGIWQIDAETGKTELLAEGDLFGSLGSSPDSQYVAVAHTVIDQGDEVIKLALNNS
jgi:tricorn protease-like protein